MQTPPSLLVDPLLPLNATQASAYSFDGFSPGGTGMDADWRHSAILYDIQNLLAGYPAYGVPG